MKKIIALVVMMLFAVSVQAGEVAVSSTVNTRVDADAMYRKAIEVQNNGSTAIFCVMNGGALTATQLRTRGRKIAAGDVWQLAIPSGATLNCVAQTSSQVGGADPSTATSVTEVF